MTGGGYMDGSRTQIVTSFLLSLTVLPQALTSRSFAHRFAKYLKGATFR